MPKCGGLKDRSATRECKDLVWHVVVNSSSGREWRIRYEDDKIYLRPLMSGGAKCKRCRCGSKKFFSSK